MFSKIHLDITTTTTTEGHYITRISLFDMFALSGNDHGQGIDTEVVRSFAAVVYKVVLLPL